jgi:hypothetical protein
MPIMILAGATGNGASAALEMCRSLSVLSEVAVRDTERVGDKLLADAQGRVRRVMGGGGSNKNSSSGKLKLKVKRKESD